MKNYNIGICGFGYVGKAIYSLVNESKNMSNTSIHIYDPYSALSIKNNYNINSSNKFKHVDIAFVCVPTPPCSDGKCDWELVEESAAAAALCDAAAPSGGLVCMSAGMMGRGASSTRQQRAPTLSGVSVSSRASSSNRKELSRLSY